MKKSLLILVLPLVFGVIFWHAYREVKALVPSKPNVVFVLFDDLDILDVGLYNPESEILTPTIDTLRSEGVKFNNFYQNAASCLPTRAALMTGQYPHKSSLQMICKDDIDPNGIPPDVTTLPELLAQKGYVAGHFGKWQMGTDRPEHFPNGQGFIKSAIRRGGYINPLISHDGGPFQTETGHLTDIITDHTLNFLDEYGNQPFFLNVWHFAPHTPLQPNAHWAAQYPDTDRGKFAALMSHADEQLQRIIDKLKALGVYDNTIIVVMSDNGGHVDTHPPSNELRGSKGEFFERGIKSPLIVVWKDHLLPNIENDSTMLGFDWYPTLADILGITDIHTDGESKADALLNNTLIPETRRMFWEGSFSADHFTSASDLLYRFAVRDGDWKLVMTQNDVLAQPQLFNLATDPGEQIDVSSENPGIFSDLFSSYLQWSKDVARIPHAIEFAFGKNLSIVGDTITIPNPSIIFLEDDERFDFGQRDFTFRATVNVSELNSPSIAAFDHSWRLVVGGDGRLKLVVFDEVGDTAVNLFSQNPLLPNTDYDVAFTVKGFRKNTSIVKLYVNGELQDEFSGFANFNTGDHTIVIGNNKTLVRPFIGTIKDIAMYLTTLRPEDL